MRVAVVCPYAFDAHGGVQDQVGQIVGSLNAAGHIAWAVAPGSGGPEGTRHVGGFISLPANRSRAPIALGPGTVRRVANAVADADVVHIHEPFMPLVSLAALLVETPPKVGTFHADPGRFARVVYRIGSPLLRRWAGRLGAVTVVSEVAAQAVDRIIVPSVVPNGIDLDRFAEQRAARVAGRVVFVGRDEARKGLGLLLEAWPGIVADHPDATLHVVGASRPDAPQGVVYLGRVPDEHKLRELLSAEVLVAPNRSGESFGIVVLEGLAAGCAVVASDLQAFRAVAGSAATYVPVDDVVAIADATRHLLASPKRLTELRAAGLQRSLGFDRRQVLASYLAAYEEALAGV